MVWIRSIDRSLAFCDGLFLVLANACLAIMFVANAANMGCRAVFDTSFALVWPWTMVLFVWCIFLGFFPLYRRGRDVTVDFFVRRLGPFWRCIVGLIVCLIVIAVVTVLLAAAPYRLASQAGIIEMVGLPRVVLSIPFFASCLLILINCLVRAAHLLSPQSESVSSQRTLDWPRST